MKTITLYEKKWGPQLLRDPETRKMCCLGQAMQQCGMPARKLDNKPLPVALARGTLTQEAKDFADAVLHTKPSEGLYAAIYALKYGRDPDFPDSPGDLEGELSSLNDWYFAQEKQTKTLRDKVVRLLRRGFKEAGYRLVFVPKEAK